MHRAERESIITEGGLDHQLNEWDTLSNTTLSADCCSQIGGRIGLQQKQLHDGDVSEASFVLVKRKLKRSSENSISNNPLIVQLMSGLPTKKFGGVKTKNDVLRNVLLLFNSGQKPKSSTYRLIRISEEQNRQGMANNISNSNKNIAIPLLRQLWT
uniref:Uncharacterized protein n=1 Tax=Meloidogyne hapla TaxID=6305 RepID=A0A1I8BYG6_MELHA